MKDYHSIPSYREHLGKQCIAFDKLDGSNLRAEWNAKRGWYKWGTRRRMMDRTDPEYGEAVDIFERVYGDALIDALKASRFGQYIKNGVVAFMEFYGPHSFAGKHAAEFLHVESNDPKQVMVFDVNINKKGMLGPKDFIHTFTDAMPIPHVIYQGEVTEEFVDMVRKGQSPVVEGVVCKGGESFDHSLWMAKVKTLTYLQRLKDVFGTGWEQYWE